MAQGVKCLLSKPESLCSNPQNLYRKPDVGTHISNLNPSGWQQSDKGRSGAFWSSSLVKTASSRFSERRWVRSKASCNKTVTTSGLHTGTGWEA